MQDPHHKQKPPPKDRLVGEGVVVEEHVCVCVCVCVCVHACTCTCTPQSPSDVTRTFPHHSSAYLGLLLSNILLISSPWVTAV